MSNGEDITKSEERSDHGPSFGDEPKLRKWLGVNIKLVDGHYLATFNHDAPRIFHNVQELLTAIEVEAAKLSPGPTQT